MRSVKPHQGIWDDPYHILITTILSTRTKDEVTDKVSLRLFCKYPDPKSLANARIQDLVDILRGVGFYRQKASSIKNTARIIHEKYNGIVPSEKYELIELPGVGTKVANIVLTFGYGKDYIAVDTHVHRIFNRIGVVRTKSPEKTEKELELKLPKKYWKVVNSYGVEFGKTICKPIKPRCEICQLRKVCKYYEVHS